MADPGVFTVGTKQIYVRTLHYQNQATYVGYEPPVFFPPAPIEPPAPLPVEHDLTLIGARGAVTLIEQFRGQSAVELSLSGFEGDAFESSSFQVSGSLPTGVRDAVGIGVRRAQTLIRRGN